MRFSALAGPGLASLATYLGISLFNVYAVSLYLNGQLTLYIHPRYVLFTAALNAASLLACCVGFVVTSWRVANGTITGGIALRPSLALLVAGLVLAAAYALPASTLSSSTAAQRADNLNGAQAPSPRTGDTLSAFGAGDALAHTPRLAIEDWVSAFGLEPDPDYYQGQEVDVVGFVFHPEGAPRDVFYVSRFVVTCCAVDARPIGLPVRSPGWQGRFEKDSWVRVTGRFVGAGGGVPEPVAVEPRSIEPAEQPQNPYVVG